MGEIDENAEKTGPRSDTEGKPSMVRDQEVAGSNPVAPTQRDRKPFGENIEGLSLREASEVALDAMYHLLRSVRLPYAFRM